MAGAGALLTGLGGLLVGLAGLVALLRPRPAEDNDDDVAAWRDRALAAERDRDDYRDRWIGCVRARGAPTFEP